MDLLFATLALAYAKTGREMTEHARVLASREPADVALRARCLHGIGVAGLYFPAGALTELDRLLHADLVTGAEIVSPLALIAGLHPLRVRAWADQQPAESLTSAVTAATDVNITRTYLEALGFYNNAVNLNAYHPKMRRGVGMTVFSLYLDSSSRREWSKRYAHAGFAMLREAEYELIRWTEPD